MATANSTLLTRKALTSFVNQGLPVANLGVMEGSRLESLDVFMLLVFARTLAGDSVDGPEGSLKGSSTVHIDWLFLKPVRTVETPHSIVRILFTNP